MCVVFGIVSKFLKNTYEILMEYVKLQATAQRHIAPCNTCIHNNCVSYLKIYTNTQNTYIHKYTKYVQLCVVFENVSKYLENA